MVEGIYNKIFYFDYSLSRVCKFLCTIICIYTREIFIIQLQHLIQLIQNEKLTHGSEIDELWYVNYNITGFHFSMIST